MSHVSREKNQHGYDDLVPTLCGRQYTNWSTLDIDTPDVEWKALCKSCIKIALKHQAKTGSSS